MKANRKKVRELKVPVLVWIQSDPNEPLEYIEHRADSFVYRTLEASGFMKKRAKGLRITGYQVRPSGRVLRYLSTK